MSVTMSLCVCVRLIAFGEQMQADDVATNISLARHGADSIEKRCSSHEQLKILTHCNTGSLATAGYGTALGLLRISVFLTLFTWTCNGVAVKPQLARDSPSL